MKKLVITLLLSLSSTACCGFPPSKFDYKISSDIKHDLKEVTTSTEIYFQATLEYAKPEDKHKFEQAANKIREKIELLETKVDNNVERESNKSSRSNNR